MCSSTAERMAVCRIALAISNLSGSLREYAGSESRENFPGWWSIVSCVHAVGPSMGYTRATLIRWVSYTFPVPARKVFIVLAMGLKPSPSGETFRFFFIVGSNLSKDNKIKTWHVSERTSVRSSRPKNLSASADSNSVGFVYELKSLNCRLKSGISCFTISIHAHTIWTTRLASIPQNITELFNRLIG